MKAIATSLLAVGLITLASNAGAQDSFDIHEYGARCAKEIVEVPVFNCLDLDIVPITVNGKEPETYTAGMKCDRPALLPYPEATHGQCAPYSRIKVTRDDDVQMVLLCRRMYVRPADDPHFDSIEVLMHNVKTGSTCFFISKNFGGKPEGDDGSRIPPPTELEPPKGDVSAKDLWGTPQEIADHGCIYCHDSDPWMRTPWVGQTGQLPADPHGFHSVDVGGPFANWPKPKSISTRGNTCTGCHRIGSLNTCKTMFLPTFGEQPAKMLQSIGQAPHGHLGARRGTIYDRPPEVFDSWASTYPYSVWMPLGNELPYAEWRRIYQQDVDDLQHCCESPEAPGCIVSPIQSLKSWLAEQDANSAESGSR